MKFEILRGDDLIRVADTIILESSDFHAAVTIGSVSARHCDEGIVIKRWRRVIGIATIAPKGETGGGQPTIVGVYVRPKYRGRGFGTELLTTAVRRCLDRGFDRIRVDAMTSGGKKIIDKLPPELLAHIDVRDLSHLFPF